MVRMMSRWMSMCFLMMFFFNISLPLLAEGETEASIVLDAKDTANPLVNNTKVTGAVSSLNWVMKTTGIVMAVFFMIMAGGRINSGHYLAGIASIVAAMVSGLAGFLVTAFIG